MRRVYTVILLLIFVLALSGCGQKEMVTSTFKLSLDSREATVTLTYPKEGFSSFWMNDLRKDDAQKEKLDKYRRTIASDFSSVVVGPKYSIVVTHMQRDTDIKSIIEGAAKNGYKEVTYGGVKGYAYNANDYASYSTAYPTIYLPYADSKDETHKKNVVIVVISNESLELEYKYKKKEIGKDDPALKKAAEATGKLLEDKELQEILKSMKVNIPEKK